MVNTGHFQAATRRRNAATAAGSVDCRPAMIAGRRALPSKVRAVSTAALSSAGAAVGARAAPLAGGAGSRITEPTISR